MISIVKIWIYPTFKTWKIQDYISKRNYVLSKYWKIQPDTTQFGRETAESMHTLEPWIMQGTLYPNRLPYSLVWVIFDIHLKSWHVRLCCTRIHPTFRTNFMFQLTLHLPTGNLFGIMAQYLYLNYFLIYHSLSPHGMETPPILCTFFK